MDRAITENLILWKNSKNRKPLILKGVRQCGKTYLLNEFGKNNYEGVAYFNFEGNDDLNKIFQKNLEPERILFELSLMHGSKINSSMLIIFDEIQFCTAALTSLKYFYEKSPEYHIACAGSLLGLLLPEKRDDKLSFPVGKVDFLTLRPMNFLEFVNARLGPLYYDLLKNIKPGEELPESSLNTLENTLKEYYIVGGMPEAVESWILEKDLESVEKIQRNLITSYESDFTKYANKNDGVKLRAIWNSIPKQISKENKRFIFGQAVEGARSHQLVDSLQWLLDSGLIHRVRMLDKIDIPLSNNASDKLFKLYLTDIGLLRMMAGISASSIMSDDEKFGTFKGGITENFVLNELLTAFDDGNEYFYWKNPKGNAEVDFVISVDGNAIPIEVKSGNVPRIRSMEEYIRRFEPKQSFVVSKENYKNGKLTFLPLYLVWKMNEYAKR